MKTAVLGMQFGDEGKARVLGALINDYDWVVRFNGAGNAGHTVYDDRGNECKFHLVPSGAAFNKKVAIDTGMAVNLADLKAELDALNRPVDLYVSENVHVITEKHLESDADGSGIGSTKRGIAYVYADRALRKGVRVTQDMLDQYGIKAKTYRGLVPSNQGESILFEGAQAIMLDVDHGCYPYVTSSSIIPNGAYRVNDFVGVMKAYCTRVGDGPPYYPDNEDIRVAGKEYGTTTGRPRKCTWLDVDQVNYAISIVGPERIAVTKLDILDGMQISVYRGGLEYVIGDLDAYQNFLLETFPMIKWFSKSPKGDMEMVR